MNLAISTMLAAGATLALAGGIAAQAAWSQPTFEAALNDPASDVGGHVAADGLTFHLCSQRSSTWEIWVSQRTNRWSPWGAPVRVAELSAGGPASSPFVRADGLEIFFSSNRGGTQGNADIMRATRASPALPWDPPTFVGEVNSPDVDDAPSVTADGLTLFFVSSRPGPAPANPPNGAIWMAQRPNLGSPFGMPVLVPEVSSLNAERDAEISPDGLRIVFVRQNRTTGATDLMLAARTSTAKPFATPQPIVDLASTAFTMGPTMSAENDVLWFSRLYSVGTGAYEIMSSRFDGLTASGRLSPAATMRLHYRDSGAPSLPYFGAFSLGSSPGFMLGARRVPLNPDPLFLYSATGIPGLTTAYAGTLDGRGQATGVVGPGLPALAGLNVWTAFFTIDPAAPFAIRTISNPVEIEFVP